jgi:hypothetical protein
VQIDKADVLESVKPLSKMPKLNISLLIDKEFTSADFVTS